MNFSLLRKNPSRAIVLVAAGLLFAAGSLAAADSPADATPAPAPAAPPPPPSGAWFVFSPPKEGDVLPPLMREKLLALVKTILDRSNSSVLGHVQDAANPFFPKLPPAPAPASSIPGNATPALATTPQLSSVEKLQEVADQLKPSGALIGGQNRLIVFADGDTMAAGQSIHVTFPGDSAPAEILLQEVTSEKFTLKMGDTTKAFPFVAKESAAHSNSPTTTPEPKSRDSTAPSP